MQQTNKQTNKDIQHTKWVKIQYLAISTAIVMRWHHSYTLTNRWWDEKYSRCRHTHPVTPTAEKILQSRTVYIIISLEYYRESLLTSKYIVQATFTHTHTHTHTRWQTHWQCNTNSNSYWKRSESHQIQSLASSFTSMSFMVDRCVF